MSYLQTVLKAAFAAVVVGLVPSAPSAQTAELTPIRWGGTPSIELMTPLYVAMAQGYLAEEGLTLDSPMMGPGSRVREALAADEIDIGDVGALTYIVGRAAGLDQRIVLEYYTKQIFGLYVSEKNRDTIKTMDDLKGKTVFVSALGSSAHMAGLAFVRKAGLNASDVNFVGLGSADPATMIAALESGQFDAGIVWEPTSTLLLDRKAAFPLIDIRDPEQHRKWLGERSASMVMAVNESLIEEKPEMVAGAVAAQKKALAFIRDHTAKEVAEVAAPQFKMDPATLERILTPIKDNFSPDGSISRSGLELEIGLALDGGAVKKKLEIADMIDPQFAGESE